jgi:hypothetical protein
MMAKVIAVETYTGQPLKYTELYKGFGGDFLGVVINKVPRKLMKKAGEEAGAGGAKVLGVMPEDRVLLAITVGELAESIGGEIINNPEKSGELVESYMLGVMTPDTGTEYFKRKSNKAALIRQERADMQLAALETPTSCLVLGGGSGTPIYNVLNKAQRKSIPIIQTDTNISEIIENIDNIIIKTRLNQEKKLVKLGEIVKQNLDMKIFG